MLLLSVTHGPELGQLVHLEDGEGLLIVLLLLAHVLELLEVVHALNLFLLQLAHYFGILSLVLRLYSILQQVVDELLGLVTCHLEALLQLVLELDVEVQHLLALDVSELHMLAGLENLEEVQPLLGVVHHVDLLRRRLLTVEAVQKHLDLKHVVHPLVGLAGLGGSEEVNIWVVIIIHRLACLLLYPVSHHLGLLFVLQVAHE